MNYFDNFFQESLLKRKQQGILRNLTPIDAISSVRLNYQNQEYLNFSSNDYLGLSINPYLEQKSQEWIEQYGVGCSASRLVTGHTSYHEIIEADLAKFLGTEAALIFASGWQANVAVISCLLENLPKPVWVITDKLNHASLHYGCKAGQTKQIRFRHNDMRHLQERLDSIQNENGSKLIITETIFSMDGDQADLQGLRRLANEYQAFLFLDDAHATGVLGTHGQGLASSYADLTMGTFSKAWGSFGAYIAGSKALCDWLINYCSGFIHTTALPPAVSGSISAALELIPTLDAERTYLQTQCLLVKQQLTEWGVDVGDTVSQIIPLIVGSAENALEITQSLREEKIWVTPIRPPTVPVNSSRLRLTLSAAHQAKDIQYLLEKIHMLIVQKPSSWKRI
ncbi:7-keto-8-aminopelargonate synthetase or related enzyme (BioF) (PDB:1BS0) [Commensalibacter communis]|uniref:8-amino-7-oxononanoate synthase n=1 Tax=Commensalibacter communis TaxID=2972786 RepID=A0A9W4X673_9PROT|nr:8-amino-7-oxononanoate synthase [Commensalibacter communis]CAI3926687.1 7-keto-8-aminopelargonate synthetase or related enzyme (BioF) (PDB:1BS0) [Commensalibacter communis]CAI3927300.1 7-keto-8-aminopelargonate synthetase or related enzyme (BioF) (PDB:1BS0) [Commensalibacter communis]CAI3934152.1 7-keto-8-aminopelargonate synthetase or related enzyme (BioF) (PDB:1BS0) [Commensalibacter communis]CAI3935731.1 7-keto-8-aminopelargonate synthetase or related enzyme (BioF) (PDB:1BS0) [Commensalib